MKRFVDLSTSIESGLPVDPPAQIPAINYISHKASAELFANVFGCTQEELPLLSHHERRGACLDH